MQLILNTFGTSLRKQDGMFLVMANDRKALLSPEKVDSILLATGVHLSTDVIRLAIEHLWHFHSDFVSADAVGLRPKTNSTACSITPTVCCTAWSSVPA